MGWGRCPGHPQSCREQGVKTGGPALGPVTPGLPWGHPVPTWQEPPYLFLPLLLTAARGALFSDLVSSTTLQGGVCLLMAMGLLTVTGLLTTRGLLTVTGFATGTGFVTVTSFVVGTDLLIVTGLVTGTGRLTVTGLETGTGRLTVTGLLMLMGLLIVTGLLTPMGLLTPTGRLTVTGRLTGPGLGAGRGRSMWFQIRCFSSWVLEVNAASQKGQGKVSLSEMAPWWRGQTWTLPSQQPGQGGPQASPSPGCSPLPLGTAGSGT